MTTIRSVARINGESKSHEDEEETLSYAFQTCVRKFTHLWSTTRRAACCNSCRTTTLFLALVTASLRSLSHGVNLFLAKVVGGMSWEDPANFSKGLSLSGKNRRFLTRRARSRSTDYLVRIALRVRQQKKLAVPLSAISVGNSSPVGRWQLTANCHDRLLRPARISSLLLLFEVARIKSANATDDLIDLFFFFFYQSILIFTKKIPKTDKTVEREKSRFYLYRTECYRNRGKRLALARSLYEEIDVCFILSIRSNPDKSELEWRAQWDAPHALALRAELNATINCSPESAGDAECAIGEISPPTFVFSFAFERSRAIDHRVFFFFFSSCPAPHSTASGTMVRRIIRRIVIRFLRSFFEDADASNRDAMTRSWSYWRMREEVALACFKRIDVYKGGKKRAISISRDKGWIYCCFTRTLRYVNRNATQKYIRRVYTVICFFDVKIKMSMIYPCI